MGRKKGTSMYAPYKGDIIRLLDDGKTVKQIFRTLFPEPNSGYQYQTFLNYINHNGLRFVTDNEGYEETPVCAECKECASVKRFVNSMENLTICLAEKREIGPYKITSPKWCPKRDKKRQGEV